MQVLGYSTHRFMSPKPILRQPAAFRPMPGSPAVYFGVKPNPGVALVGILAALVAPLFVSKPVNAQESRPLIESKGVSQQDKKQPSTATSAAVETSKQGIPSTGGDIVITTRQRYQLVQSAIDENIVYVVNKFNVPVGHFKRTINKTFTSQKPEDENPFDVLGDPLPNSQFELTTQKRYRLVQSADNPDIIELVEGDKRVGSFYKSGAGIYNRCDELIARAEGNKAYEFPPGRFFSDEPLYTITSEGKIDGPIGYEEINAIFPKTMTFKDQTTVLTPTLQVAVTTAIFADCRPEPGQLEKIFEQFLNRRNPEKK